MRSYTVVVLPGDGIGPEVIQQAERVLDATAERFRVHFLRRHHPIGAVAIPGSGDPFPAETRAAVLGADAVLLGAVGDPAFDQAPRHLKPETGLLGLRSALGAYANLRPVAVHPTLTECSPLRAERLQGVDLLIVRELTGGLYYGEPRGNTGGAAVNTLRYTVPEIERVARSAFAAAMGRRRRLLSVDKANVLETSQLWRETVSRVGREFPEVALEHGYVDSTAMRLVADPISIDVLLTENLFGDILSDEAAVLVGSLGLLPSASLGTGPGLFEPVHGSAPALTGKDLANPIGAIASAGMLLRYGLRLPEMADAVEQAIGEVLGQGLRTRDIAVAGQATVGTAAMGQAIAEQIRLSR